MLPDKLLILTVGLPRSGKTTWAREYIKHRFCPIVNPDSVRLAIHGQRFVSLAEGFVWATTKAMVRALFLAGHDTIILDATGIKKKNRDEWLNMDWRVEYKVFDTPKEECITRAIQMFDEEIIPVIERMAAEYEPLDAYERGHIFQS